METDVFEKALDAYLETIHYDQMQELLYQFARSTFPAGWQAAQHNYGARITVLQKVTDEDTKRFE